MPTTTCVATTKGTEKCGEKRKPNSRYCEGHQDRPGAVKERAEKGIEASLDANQIVDIGTAPTQTEIRVPETSQTAEVMSQTPSAPASVFDRVLATLDRTQDLTADAYIAYKKRLDLIETDPEAIRYTDKAGAEQARTELSWYERAVDREIRAMTGVAKLAIENQQLNMNEALKGLITSVVIKVFRRMDLSPEEVDRAGQLLSEEFANLKKKSSS